MEPLVSIVIPFYSGVEWLTEALISVQNQTYKNLEVLVINDGSKEDISKIHNILDIDIHIIYKENGGPASARNLGIEKSSGKYIAFLDSDDLWMPDKLSQQIGYMEKTNSIWCQHSYEMFWDDGDRTKIINTSVHSGNVLKDCFISLKIQTSCVVVLKKALLENNICFPLEKRYGQDGAFYRQIAKDYPLGYVDGVLSRFRIRGANAGFRAKVQLNDKAATWKEIKNDKTVLSILPKPIILAYKTTAIFSNIIKALNRFIKCETSIEFISKIMYAFPYTVYKLYSHK